MNRQLVFGFFLATAVAMPAGWSIVPFKRSKPAPDQETQELKKTKDSNKKPSSKKDAKIDKKHDKKNIKGFDGLYAGGTVARIPQATNGKLDLSDPTTMRFQFGKPVWSVDYSKIRGIEVADKKTNPFIKVPLVTKDKRVFTIAFDDNKGKKQQMIVELTVPVSLKALPLLEERTGKNATVAGATPPDSWWGDRYWKTARNAQVWDEATGQNKTSLAQAK